VVAPDRRLVLTLTVPGSLGGAPEIVLETQARRVRPGSSGWGLLATSVAPVVRLADARSVRLDAPIDHPAGAELEVQVVAYRPPGTPTTECRTRSLDLPAMGSLDVAFGILEAARGLGAVRFTIDVCDEAERCSTLFDETVDPAADESAAWHERRLALGAHGGGRRSFRFRTTDQAGHSLPVWAHPTLLAPAPTHVPNLLLVSIDTLRRDHLDLYGYPRETAPSLGRFATRGTVFDGLVAEAGTTDPSHMTMFTSLPALVHGVAGGLTVPRVPLATLAEAFRGAGYRTAAFTEDGPLAHDRGFALGFDAYGENKSASLMNPTGQVDRTFGQVRRWIARHADEPFFVFAHTFQVHAPYSPPGPYRRFFTGPLKQRRRRSQGDVPARQYDREIRYVDDELARLIEWLERRGLLARTLIVILSDHGEEFYEHGVLGHAALPWEEILRVPLVMVGPGVPAGRREPALVHHLDLMPTLLALANVPAPGPLYGRNVASWTADAGTARGQEPLFSASWALPRGMVWPALTVRRGDLKLIRHRDARGQHDRVFDLRADPREQHALRDPEIESALAKLLDEWTAAAAEDARRRRASAATPGAPAAPGFDPEREDKLRSLGYLE
jgi:arylsulfatase A-like enzyme